MHRGAFERTAVLALAALALLACGKRDKAGEGESEAAAPVQVEAARRGPIDHIINVDAVLYPVNQSNVMAKISAPVERVMVNRGDHVRPGQVIAQLENRDLVAAVGESRGQLEQAQAAYQTTTGATVLEEAAKAKVDVDSAAQALEASRRLYENRVALQKETDEASKELVAVLEERGGEGERAGGEVERAGERYNARAAASGTSKSGTSPGS